MTDGTGGTNLLRMVQQKIAEKDEIIHEQQRQINELSEKLNQALAGGADPSEISDRDEVIAEQQRQIEELTEKLARAESGTADAGELAEMEALVAEQMTQINDLTEKLAATEAKLVEFDALQAQLKELLG